MNWDLIVDQSLWREFREERIKELAYKKWQASGEDRDYWFEAEKEFVEAEKLVIGS